MPAVNPRGFAGYFTEQADPPPAPPKPVRQYRFLIDCPCCGGTLYHEARTRGGLDSKAVVHCPPCHRRYTIDVHLRPCSTGKTNPPRAWANT